MMKKRIIFLFTHQTRRVYINIYFVKVIFLELTDQDFQLREDRHMFILPRQATAHMVKVRLKNSGDLIGILLRVGVWQANKKMMKKRIIFLFTYQTRRVLINTYFFDVNFLSTADVSRFLFGEGRRLNFITPRERAILLSINEIKVKTLISIYFEGRYKI